MSALAAEQDQVKIILRGLLISSAQTLTAEQLHRDYRLQEGQNVPYHKLGYLTFLEYLRSIPDAVSIGPACFGGSPVVLPVVSDKVSHIDALVQKQKIGNQKLRTERRPPALRQSWSPPEINSRNYDVKKRILIPHPLQQRICRMVRENPKGVPVQSIEREFFSAQIRQNYGINYGYDVYHLLGCLSHQLKISNGMVYPLPYTQHGLFSGSSVAGHQESDNSVSIHRFLPSRCQSYSDTNCQSDALKEDVYNGGEISDKSDSHFAVAVCDRIGATDVTQNDKGKAVEDVKAVPNMRSPSVDTGAYTNASDVIGETLKMNFHTLLNKHPSGIWCSELPDLYQDEFRVPLKYFELGFVSVIQMASHLPDVFHCVRPDGTDWKLFSTQKELPSQYSSYDIKSNKSVSTRMVPTVPSKVKHNIQKLLKFHQRGLPSDQLLTQYREMYLIPVPLEEMGFDSVESFLLSLNDSVLHMRYVNKKILVYPHANNEEPEKDNPLLHITDPQNLFADLYPPEVMGPKGTLPYQKIPPDAAPGGYLEVLVAEIYTPQNFWVQLRGENTHLALDTLMNNIQDFYEQEANNYKMPAVTVKIGQYCMAPYSGEWHRVCITAVLNFHDVKVLFVDYGTISRVKKSDLRFMHLDFAEFPIQAIKASLVNLVPAGGAEKWPCEVSKRFLELVSEKSLVASISSVDHEARKLEIALVDTCGIEDVHINDLLVDEGLAEYQTNRLTVPPPSPAAPQIQRIDAGITVNRPPPGFSAEIPLQRQSGVLSAGFAAPAQSETVTETQRQSLPNLPHINSSNFIPKSTSVPVAPTEYNVLSFANTNPFLAQASTLQQLMYCNYLLQHQPLMRSLLMSDPTFALLISQNISAASLANPFGVPMLNPSMLYSPSVTSHDINLLPDAANNTPAMQTVTKSPPPTAEDVATETEETFMSQEKKNENDLMMGASNNMVDTKICSQSDPCDKAKLCGMESDSDPVVESSCGNEGEEPYPSSDEIYRSDYDEDDDDSSDDEEEDKQQNENCVLKPHYVKEIEIAGRMVHLINVSNSPYLCTEEVVRTFTDFSGRHVVLKILGARRAVIPFSEIGQNDIPALIEDLENYDILGVPKSPAGFIMGKVHLIPLQSVPKLLTVLNVEGKAAFCIDVLEEIEKFDPEDTYWRGNSSAVAW